MFQNFGNVFGQRIPQRGGSQYLDPPGSALASTEKPADRRQTYSKIFRWRLPDGQTHTPVSVEIVGTFTHWQKVPLMRDSVLDAWHATIHHIVNNRTHHYMLLVDGKPAHDKSSDGLAVPHGPQEERYQLMTDRGPRLFMLFGQTK